MPWARVVWLSNESADETRIRDAAKMFSRNKEVSYRALSPFLSLKCQNFKCCFDVAASKSGRPEGGGYSPPPCLSLSEGAPSDAVWQLEEKEKEKIRRNNVRI